MPSTWITAVAWAALAQAFASSAWIAYDIYGRGNRQKMGVMEPVWPITALYLGVAAVLAYRRWGRPSSPAWTQAQGATERPRLPRAAMVATAVGHCGAGCTIGDIIAEFGVFFLGAQLLGVALIPEYIGDYTLALIFGIAFQYFAIVPMRGLGFRDGLRAAVKADFLSLTAFEVGLFAWMALMAFVFYPHPHLHPTSPVYWFLMQTGMIVGFATSWPMNVWLIRRGIKEAM